MSLQPKFLQDDGFNALKLIVTAWHARWLIIFTTLIFGVVAAIYSLLATEWFRTEVVLMPVERRASQSGLSQLSGLANLAGISMGQSSSQEAIAVLRSKDYAREFIAEHKLTPVLLTEDQSSDDVSDDQRALRIFEALVRTVEFDRKTGLVTVTIRWTDRDTVATWANDYVSGVNERMRRRALAESESNVAYLNKEMTTATVVSMQQSIGRVLESEMQKLMLARGNAEFAFKVVDPGYPPDRRYSPRRTLTVLIAMFVGGIVAILFVLMRDSLARFRKLETFND